MPINESLIISQFFTSMHRCGIKPRENFNPDMDGKTHRFAVDGDRGNSKSGAYFVHVDGCPNWGIMDYHSHTEMQKFSFDFDTLSDDERREYLKQNNISTASGFSGVRTISQIQRVEIERRTQEKANAMNEIQQRALSMALSEYRVAEPFAHETYTFSHPYFLKKFVDTGIYLDILRCSIVKDFRIARVNEPYKGGICKAGELLIPMRNILTGDFQSLIHIPVMPDSEGRFLKLNYKNTTLTGAAHWLITEKSKNSDTVFCCEGISTGLALLVDLQGRYPVFSCGSCGNLHSVCEALRKRYPAKKIIIISDNDKNGAGKKAADKCKQAGLADGIRMPEISGHDWYDRLITKRKGI